MQGVDARDVAALRRLELSLPAPQLAFEKPGGTTHVGQPHLGRVHGVQNHHGVQQGVGDRAGASRPHLGQFCGRLIGPTLDEAHDVERRPDHLWVLAQQDGLGDCNAGGSQRGQETELAGHVVRGGQHMPQRWPAQNPAGVAVAEQVGEVGSAALDQPR